MADPSTILLYVYLSLSLESLNNTLTQSTSTTAATHSIFTKEDTN